MKSISFAGLFASTLVASASAMPHFNSIFGRGDKDACYTAYGQGTCGSPKDCKRIVYLAAIPAVLRMFVYRGIC